MTKTTGQPLAKNLNKLLDSYNLRKKIIAYVKYEGLNLDAMTMALKIIVNCDILGLEDSFNGTCFGHVFSKTCQYAIIEKKICKNLKFIFVKSTEFDIQKCVTWPRKSGKGRQEWSNACTDMEFQPRKLNTLVKTR
jgi:hypothetical protein